MFEFHRCGDGPLIEININELMLPTVSLVGISVQIMFIFENPLFASDELIGIVFIIPRVKTSSKIVGISRGSATYSL